MHSEQQPPTVPPGISHQRYKCFTTRDHGDTAPDLRVGVWKGGREGMEAEGIACTTLPRLHLNHRAGGAPRLGSEPNPLLADAAPSRASPGSAASLPGRKAGRTPGHTTGREESPKPRPLQPCCPPRFPQPCEAVWPPRLRGK